MVGALALCSWPLAACWLPLAEAPAASGHEPLPDQLKIALLILWAGVAVLGIVLLLVAWAIGRYAQRTVRRSHRQPPPTGIGPSDWDAKPWQPNDQRDEGQMPTHGGSAEP